MAAGQRASQTVAAEHERSVMGPHTGGNIATTSSWVYVDCTAYAGQYIRFRTISQKAYAVMVATGTTTPASIGTTGSIMDEDNTAELFAEGEVHEWVVDKDFPYMALKRGESTNGTVFVRPA